MATQGLGLPEGAKRCLKCHQNFTANLKGDCTECMDKAVKKQKKKAAVLIVRSNAVEQERVRTIVMASRPRCGGGYRILRTRDQG